MKFSLWLMVALLVSAVGVVPSQAAPEYTFIEAEANAQGFIKADPEASGGKYAAQAGAYQPLIIADLPAQGDSFVVWARVRGVTLQLKGVATDGRQHEFNWVWDKPQEWKWVSFGRHTRAELGAKFLLMRAPDASPDAGLDAVVLTMDDTFSPETLPLALPKLAPIAVTMNWNAVIGHAAPFSYGLNAFAGFNPAVSGNRAYQSNLNYMAPGILRLHNWGMMGDSAKDPNGWIDQTHQRWDAAKIKAALAGFPANATLLINIPGWPDWMDKNKDGFLDADQIQAFARFCADLVRIVSNDCHRSGVFWEVTNEQDGRYFVDFHTSGGWGPLKDTAKPDRVEELANIYVQCAQAMKAVDPATHVGGVAQARPDLAMFAQRFAHVAAPHLDFFTFHAYASGTASDSDNAIFNAAVSFGDAAKAFQAALSAESPHRAIPLFLDEYNVSWTWETRDSRMITIKGAVFDALVVTSAVTHGVDATFAWNERDGIYGKTDNSDVRRPGATLFHLLNAYMIGDIVSTTSTDPQAIVAYAVRGTRGQKSLLLVNRSRRDQRVTLTPWSYSPLKQCRLDATGYAETTLMPALLAAPLVVPADSVTLLTGE